jgi:ABC-2 type transport system ATP-binding protein
MTPPCAIEARGVSRRFGQQVALNGVSLGVPAGEIHAVLGRNGAGKTTLIRILSGLTAPDEGSVGILGEDVTRHARGLRGRVGLVPSGDRSFYLRLSGLENLLFFARLHGLRKRAARERAEHALEAVGLGDAARRRVGHYSHGMQKRLSVARAILTEPPVLLVDEATHDLDPHAARVVRELVAGLSAHGTATLWATQRIEEIRGFADSVTLLREGEVAFTGTVAALADEAVVERHVLRLRPADGRVLSVERLGLELGELGTIAANGLADDEFVLQLSADTVLGDALLRLAGAGAQVVSCRDERPEMEEAFIRLTERT